MNTKLLAAAVALAVSGAASAEEWRWSVTPYVWATDIGIDGSVSDRAVDATIPFKDLLEDLETVAQVRVEAMHGEHGIALDLFDVTLATENDRLPLPGGSGGDLVLDTQTGMTILDLTGVYDPKADGAGFSFLYGARVINQRSDIAGAIDIGGQAGPSFAYDSNDTFVDALVGVRRVGDLPGRFSYTLAADVSTGGTKLTWSVGPSIGYSFGDGGKYQITAGYRRMVMDFEATDAVDMDMTVSGVLVGFRFAF